MIGRGAEVNIPIDWDHLSQPEFDRIVEALLDRLYSGPGVDVRAYDGRGGDGGRDVIVQHGSQLRIFQLKYFRDGFAAERKTRRKQIMTSFNAAMTHNPVEWILVIPTNPTPSEEKFVYDLGGSGPELKVTILPRHQLDSQLARFPDLVGYFTGNALQHQATVIGQEKALPLADPVDLTERARGSAVPGPGSLWRPRLAPQLEPGLVDRPVLMRELFDGLIATPDSGPAVMALLGAGGFGKTVLATQVCHLPPIDARFPGGVLWIGLGRDVRGPALASKVNDITARLTGLRPTLADPQTAGLQLGEALDACPAPVLLVVDDVWRDEQIRPFLAGGRRCRRLDTTRSALAALAAAAVVRVDTMAEAEAVSVLSQGLRALPAPVATRLLRATGRWPLLLGIANRTIVRSQASGRSAAEASLLVADRLEQAGPAGLDNRWTGNGEDRALVTASVNASLDFLPKFAWNRYLELGIFAEDVDIPYAVLALLWAESGGLDAFQTEQLGHTFIDASLATPAGGGPGLRLHDVLRAFLRKSAGPEHRAHTNRALITAVANLLHHAGHVRAASSQNGLRPWWMLPAGHQYLWRHLAQHLTDAGLADERDHLLVDLRWVAARVRRDGPVHAEADLVHSPRPEAVELARAIRCNAHLLAPITPLSSIDDILASRLDGNPALQSQVDAFSQSLTGRPRITNRWPSPDKPDPALVRSIHTGHTGGVDLLRVAPNGSWLATTGPNNHHVDGHSQSVVRIWDPAAGTLLHHLDTGHSHGVGQLHVAPHSGWLVTTGPTDSFIGSDPAVRIWDPVNGVLLHQLDTGHPSSAGQITIAPDSRWLAIASNRGDDAVVVRIWDPVNGVLLHQIDTGDAEATQVRIAPNSSWLTTSGPNRFGRSSPVVRIWDPVTGALLHQIDTGHPHGIGQLDIAPDGGWLATAGCVTFSGRDPVVRIWDPATGTQLRQLDTGHAHEVKVEIAPDGGWLATAGKYDTLVRIWDLVTGTRLQQLDIGRNDGLLRVTISPNSEWLVTTGLPGYTGAGDPVMRIWDPRTGALLHRLHTGGTVGQIHASGDSSRLVTSGSRWGGDPVVRIWDPIAGAQLQQLDSGHIRGVVQVHVDSGGSRLVTAGHADLLGGGGDPVVQIWEPVADTEHHRSNSDRSRRVEHLRIAPDGRWLATANPHSIDPVVQIRNTATGLPLHQLEVGHGARVRIAPDGNWLATANPRAGEPAVQTWDPATGARLHQLNTGHPRGAHVHIAPDSRWLATVGAAGLSDSGDPLVQTWDPITGARLHRIDTGHPHGVEQLIIAPDGGWLATAGRYRDDSVVRIWDPVSGALLHRIDTGHPHGVEKLTVAPDSSWLATCGPTSDRDPMVRIWDPVTGAPIQQLDTGHPSGVARVTVSPDSGWLVTNGPTSSYGRGDPVARLWSPVTGTRIDQIDTGQPDGIGRTHITRDGSSLILVGTAYIAFWRPESGQLAAIRLDSPIRCSSLSNDGRVLFVGSSHGLHAYDLLHA